ncbi:MAG: ABC-2 family transporter protein [Bacilli bacterium]|nr:ABC-2 family transporter protein [Bacilli bacterium]
MKKIKFSFTVIKIFMKNQMQNKTYILLDVFNMVSRCLIVFLLYSYIFKISGESINGVDYKTVLWSMFIYFCIMTFNIRNIYKLIMNDVKSGTVEMFLNKPINYIFLNFYKVIGQGIYSFVVISLLGSLAMVLFVGVPRLNLMIFIPTFIITLALGIILALIMYSIIGVLSFFIQDVRPIYWITDKLVMVLGGSYLPVGLFPKVLKFIAFISPFGAINFASSAIYNSWNSEFIIRILLQIIWIIVFVILLIFIYKKAREKTMINGG